VGFHKPEYASRTNVIMVQERRKAKRQQLRELIVIDYFPLLN